MDAMTPATPRTAAGWALRDRLLTALGIVRFYDEKIDAAILAIEAEAAEPAGARLREALAEAIMAVEAKHRYTDDAAGQQGRIELRLHGTDTDADWLAGELLRYLPALPAEPAASLASAPIVPALDVERLARALLSSAEHVNYPKVWAEGDLRWLARQIAAAYEREK